MIGMKEKKKGVRYFNLRNIIMVHLFRVRRSQKIKTLT